jgi:exosortase N
MLSEKLNLHFSRYKYVWLLLMLFLIQLYFYQSINPVFLFSSAVFIFSVRSVGTCVNHPAYMLMGLVLCVLYIFVKVQSIYIVGMVFLLMYLLNLTISRTNILPVFVALVALPITNTVLNLLSFDLRLFTTQIVARSLKVILKQVQFEGNIIYYKQHEYGVDDVCAGISMLQIGMIIALMIIAYFERKANKTATVLQISLLMSIAIVLIIVSNVFRIFTIVLFNIDEKSLVHEFAGIISLALYFAWPFYFIVKKMIGSLRETPAIVTAITKSYAGYKIMVVVVTLLISIYSLYVLSQKKSVTFEHRQIAGYQLKQFQYGVAQYSNAHVLLYIKPEVPFYAADHHPRICWKGSGYKFTKEKVMHVKGHQIVTAQLINSEQAQLYSAYWFQHNQHITSNELTWRWNALLHQYNYEMINITAATQADLDKEIVKWLP